MGMRLNLQDGRLRIVHLLDMRLCSELLTMAPSLSAVLQILKALGFSRSCSVVEASTRKREQWDTLTSGTLTPRPTGLARAHAVSVVTLMGLSESMGLCAADSASEATQRKSDSSSTVKESRYRCNQEQDNCRHKRVEEGEGEVGEQAPVEVENENRCTSPVCENVDIREENQNEKMEAEIVPEEVARGFTGRVETGLEGVGPGMAEQNSAVLGNQALSSSSFTMSFNDWTEKLK
nr:hypothetical protein Iba_chr13bCG16230 [Ipomoea batatas]